MKRPAYLNALRAFEASARHHSFSAAATELNVTPAAVGQLVRSLEDWLGYRLFHRSAGGRSRLVATDRAQQALPDLRAGFDRLNLGLQRLQQESGSGVLIVTVSPAFAAKWLLPRIDRFQTAWPGLDVRLETSLKTLDFVAQDIDIGVRYGAGSWPGLVTEKLMDEQIYPVCSPLLLREGCQFRSALDITHHTLIHDLSVDRHIGFASWEAWFERAGVPNFASERGLRINNSAAVLQAAIDGQGVALARSVMAHDDIASGRLVRLLPEVKFASALGYYVVYRAERIIEQKLQAFRQWIFEEVASEGVVDQQDSGRTRQRQATY